MEQKTVHLFVCDTLSDWEPSYVLPMLNDPTAGYRVQTVGVSREPIKTAICGATAGLALAGLLDDRPHTSNAREYLQALGYRGEAFYQDQLVVTDGNLITANATAPVDFAYHILNKLQVHSPRVLDAWYGLFTTRDQAYFFAWQQAAAEERAGGSHV